MEPKYDKMSKNKKFRLMVFSEMLGAEFQVKQKIILNYPEQLVVIGIRVRETQN